MTHSKIDMLVARKIKSQRTYGVGMSFQHCYTEWQAGRDTSGGFYRHACKWLLIERFCLGLWGQALKNRV